MVTESIEWDIKENTNKPPKDRTNKHLLDLIQSIQACGMFFNVWEKTMLMAREVVYMTSPALMGLDKKWLMRDLPDKLHGVIKPNHSESVITIWKVIYAHGHGVKICKHKIVKRLTDSLILEL